MSNIFLDKPPKKSHIFILNIQSTFSSLEVRQDKIEKILTLKNCVHRQDEGNFSFKIKLNENKIVFIVCAQTFKMPHLWRPTVA